ncbi:DMT family transporter [Geobacter sp. OR-1]|uniref:DMT family transporter n=1 Tax=Geobacter sp. OR-1 TaxID=1266765 RepID=UPI0013923901|nr:DMT family transporter [Geobacter sp. OR-1]
MNSPQNASPSPLKVYSFLVLTTFFWGGSFLFNKLGLREVPPVHFVFIRFSLAALIMLALCANRLKGMTPDILRRGATVGVALGLTNLTFVFGVSGTSISRAGILNNMFVLFIPLICALVWRDRVGRVNMAGIALAVAGIGLLASGGAGFNRGDSISTLCAAFIAIHIISVSKVLRNDDVYLISLVQFVTVATMSGIAALATGAPAYVIGTTGALSLVYCAIFPTVLCFTLQNNYQGYTTPTRAGLIYTLDPVWSLLAGIIFLGERLEAREWIGCGLIFMAVLAPLLFRLLLERRLQERYKG